MQILPERIRKLWNEWQLRVMVLISLSLQIILIMLGNRRRYTARNRVRIVLWLTYLSADWVATVSLGVLSNSQEDSELHTVPHPDSVIMAFWAPFLLVHLGGPDTITAFSLEDNELWLRHFLGLLVQVGVAFYVFLRSWTTGTYHFTFVTIPMFIAGIIKYGERTWVLRSASRDHFRDSLLPPPNPGTDYVKILEECGSDKEKWPDLEEFSDYDSYKDQIDTNINPDAIIFHEAQLFFKIFRRLYADLIFSIVEIKDSYDICCERSPEAAFKLVELELGFMYDVLYTKASLVYSRAGSFLRSISFISTVSAFVGFLIVNKHDYSRVNVIISYILLAGAIVLEIYAIILLLSSDWTMLWLSKHKSPLLNRIYRVISSLRLARNKNKRWSHSMAQFNLIGFCLRHKSTKCPGIRDFFGIYEKLEKYQQIELEDVSTNLKGCIFQLILHNSGTLADWQVTTSSRDVTKEMCSYRGDEVLRAFDTYRKLGWSVEFDFDESILLWHIATNLCYYSDLNISQNANPNSDISKVSKVLSDYMIYLLVMRPFMLPKGIGQIRFQDTVAEAVRFFSR